MQRVQLDSSLLASVLYQPDAELLDVEFRQGEHYRYFRVPPECFRQLLRAESKGRFFNRNIRNHFAYQHLTGPSSPIVLARREN
jgi:hypothetical protein